MCDYLKDCVQVARVLIIDTDTPACHDCAIKYARVSTYGLSSESYYAAWSVHPDRVVKTARDMLAVQKEGVDVLFSLQRRLMKEHGEQYVLVDMIAADDLKAAEWEVRMAQTAKMYEPMLAEDQATREAHAHWVESQYVDPNEREDV